MKTTMIKLGGFLFRWRDYLFPLVVLLLFAAVTPAATIFGSKSVECAVDTLALVLIVSGLLVRMSVIGFVAVARNGVDKVVHANELFTKGMFGLCRNPLYFGNILIYVGTFLLHGAWPVVIGGTLLFLFVYYAIMFSEENYLSARFADAYTAYCETTPRLLPSLSKWKVSTKGMKFRWLRAVIVESNVIAQAVFVVSLALWYESATHNVDNSIPITSAVLLGSGIVFVLAVKWHRLTKRRKAAGR